MAGNSALKARMAGLRDQLVALHRAGDPLSNESKGNERELFVNNFLKEVLPPIFRFGTGDVIDSYGNQTGQLDVVIETPYGPSFPALGGDSVRMYLAETVAAIVEVKSNLASQWAQVQRTASKIEPIDRRFNAAMSIGESPTKIPFVAVGFQGWTTLPALKEKVDSVPGLLAALSIKEALFYWKGSAQASGPFALAGFFMLLHDQIQVSQMGGNLPFEYLE